MRSLRVGAAQLGPIDRGASRVQVVERLISLLRQGSDAGCGLVVFPELALTTFFPRWYLDDVPDELNAFYETQMPGPETQPLFDEARALGVGFYLGYAELTSDGNRYNSSVLVGSDGSSSATTAKCICLDMKNMSLNALSNTWSGDISKRVLKDLACGKLLAVWLEWRCATTDDGPRHTESWAFKESNWC